MPEKRFRIQIVACMIGLEYDPSEGRGPGSTDCGQAVGRGMACAETEIGRTSGTRDSMRSEIVREIACTGIFRKLVAAVDPLCSPIDSE